MKKPNFFIVGAARTATTSLYYYLNEHPKIYFSSIKEPAYFTSSSTLLSKNTIWESIETFSKKQKDNILHRYYKFCKAGDIKMQDLIFVKDDIMIKNKEAYLSLFHDVKEEKIISEASTSYLFYEGVAEKIYDFSPDARILISLRDPVERALSAYTYMVFKMFENLSFQEALMIENERIMQGYPHIWAYKNAGLYYEKVKKYLDVFGSQRVKIVWMEDFKDDLKNVIYEIFDFLEIDRIEVDLEVKSNVSGIPRFLKLYEQIYKVIYNNGKLKKILQVLIPLKIGKKFINVFKGDKYKIEPEIRKELCDYYREDIKKLSELTGRRLSHWANCK